MDAVLNALNSCYQSDWENGGEWWRGGYLPYSEGAGNNLTEFMNRMKEQIKSIGVSLIRQTIGSGSAAFSYNFSKGTYNLNYRDDFSNPVDIPGLEWGTPYAYYDSWLNQSVYLRGRILE